MARVDSAKERIAELEARSGDPDVSETIDTEEGAAGKKKNKEAPTRAESRGIKEVPTQCTAVSCTCFPRWASLNSRVLKQENEVRRLKEQLRIAHEK